MANNTTNSFDEWYQILVTELVKLGSTRTPDRDTAKQDYDASEGAETSAQLFHADWTE